MLNVISRVVVKTAVVVVRDRVLSPKGMKHNCQQRIGEVTLTTHIHDLPELKQKSMHENIEVSMPIAAVVLKDHMMKAEVLFL